NSFLVRVDAGRTRLRVAPSGNPPTAFEVTSPLGGAHLGEGDFSYKVSFDSSELAVRQGKATLYNAETSMVLESGKRAIAHPDRSFSGPVAAARDLIKNGDFREPLGTGWTAYEDQGADAGDIGGSTEARSLPDRQAVRFFRTSGQGNHCENGLRQRIDEDISDSHELILRLDVQVLNQSLSGGGYLSSEYPLMVRIDYRDANKNPNFWIRGFYYWSDGTWPTLNGEKVPQGIWYPYENSQLLEEMDPRPYYIDSIRIYASGWDYESLASSVELLTE
ncbi:MAG: hypothetical protein Q8O76_08195, partial [Chloroflexota bacterium]|nr:hypothetical protein [Chloroflexota bacterium]